MNVDGGEKVERHHETREKRKEKKEKFQSMALTLVEMNEPDDWKGRKGIFT